ncbi:MAG: hypothetical protein KAR44_10360 [Candidatus Aegiribacteria sp.]|nr:hypothetical protein [Candidatus Aegiribacteria sp.]
MKNISTSRIQGSVLIEIPFECTPICARAVDIPKALEEHGDILINQLETPIKSSFPYLAFVFGYKPYEHVPILELIKEKISGPSFVFWARYPMAFLGTEMDVLFKDTRRSITDLNEYEKVSLREFRETLGDKYNESMNDEEAIQLRDELYLIADSIFEYISGNKKAIEYEEE